jgi:hypothetical protein
LKKENTVSWLRKHILGDPVAVAQYRQARRELASHLPATADLDEKHWKLDMRVLELAKAVPSLRR